MFLSKQDLYPVILPEELAEITRDDDNLVAQAIEAAVSEMRGWLFDTYDVDNIFAPSVPIGGWAGTDPRHPLLVQYGADIATFTLVSRSQAGQGFDERKARYDRATAWLKAVAKADLYSDLPRRATTQQTTINHGSKAKRSNYF